MEPRICCHSGRVKYEGTLSYILFANVILYLCVHSLISVFTISLKTAIDNMGSALRNLVQVFRDRDGPDLLVHPRSLARVFTVR